MAGFKLPSRFSTGTLARSVYVRNELLPLPPSVADDDDDDDDERGDSQCKKDCCRREDGEWW